MMFFRCVTRKIRTPILQRYHIFRRYASAFRFFLIFSRIFLFCAEIVWQAFSQKHYTRNCFNAHKITNGQGEIARIQQMPSISIFSHIKTESLPKKGKLSVRQIISSKFLFSRHNFKIASSVLRTIFFICVR
jgi:hypothetical protein